MALNKLNELNGLSEGSGWAVAGQAPLRFVARLFERLLVRKSSFHATPHPRLPGPARRRGNTVYATESTMKIKGFSWTDSKNVPKREGACFPPAEPFKSGRTGSQLAPPPA